MMIYQVYPRSFNDTNGDGVGDLKGITAKLDHIKSLSVDMIWVSPFFRSPMKDYGYDVSDYRDVDPLFGTLDDFRELVREARDRGMGIMVDMVISHTSDQHAWFKASQHRQAGKDDWYVWADAQPDGSPPNNWLSEFGGAGWKWDSNRRQYYFHTFLEAQPDLNLHSMPLQDQVLSDMEFWLQMGVAGFRMDAVSHYFQDQQLRSNPPAPNGHHAMQPRHFQNHLYDMNQPETIPFLERIRVLLDRYDAFSVAEVGGAESLKYLAEYVAPGRMHSGYSFDLLGTDSNAGYIRHVLRTLQDNLPPEAAICSALSNHDVPRVATRWRRGREETPHAKQMLTLLACLRGSICLYQGEELGLPEADVPFERIQDPFGIPYWPTFKGRDGCRTPIAWTGAAQGGFSKVEPWLPVDPRHIARSVSAQETNPDSVLAFAREVFALRRAQPALHAGTIEFLGNDADLLVFARKHAGSTIVCVFNMGDQPKEFRGLSAGQVLCSRNTMLVHGHAALGVSGFCLFQQA